MIGSIDGCHPLQQFVAVHLEEFVMVQMAVKLAYGFMMLFNGWQIN